MQYNPKRVSCPTKKFPYRFRPRSALFRFPKRRIRTTVLVRAAVDQNHFHFLALPKNSYSSISRLFPFIISYIFKDFNIKCAFVRIFFVDLCTVFSANDKTHHFSRKIPPNDGVKPKRSFSHVKSVVHPSVLFRSRYTRFASASAA